VDSLPVITSHQLTLFAVVFGALAVLGIARRIPVLRTVVTLVTWVAMAGLIVALLGERERFDPYVAKFTEAFGVDDGQKVEGDVTRLRMARDGHFWVRATIGGVERRMLVDSGATVTALSERTAAAAGVRAAPSPFPMLIRTANGTVQAKTGTVAELRMGNIVARDLAVVVSPAFGDADVLGMNFLSKLKGWRVEDGTMILVPHHPQTRGTEA
jgi:aspartyl protease family protein